MATQVLPGEICWGIRRIKKADSIQVDVSPGKYNLTGSGLYVTEDGDTRREAISAVVAEVLIAYGLPYGS